MRPWYCARTEPNKEFIARRELERRGITTFLPCYLKKRPNRHIGLYLLFKGYVFISLDDPLSWPLVKRSPGVHDVFTHLPDDDSEYQTATPVSTQSVEKLHQQSLALNEIRRHPGRPKVERLISKGCHVKVTSGLFATEEYAQRALVDWAEDDRAALVLQMFNREVIVEFYLHDLEKVE